MISRCRSRAVTSSVSWVRRAAARRPLLDSRGVSAAQHRASGRGKLHDRRSGAGSRRGVPAAGPVPVDERRRQRGIRPNGPRRRPRRARAAAWQFRARPAGPRNSPIVSSGGGLSRAGVRAPLSTTRPVLSSETKARESETSGRTSLITLEIRYRDPEIGRRKTEMAINSNSRREACPLGRASLCLFFTIGVYCAAELTRQTVSPTSSVIRSARGLSMASPTGRPRAFPSASRKPVTTSSALPSGTPAEGHENDPVSVEGRTVPGSVFAGECAHAIFLTQNCRQCKKRGRAGPRESLAHNRERLRSSPNPGAAAGRADQATQAGVGL